MSPIPKKLVLFDIDGTLVRHIEGNEDSGWSPYIYAAKKVYGVEVEANPSVNYHGMVDRQIFFDIVSKLGVSKDVFDTHFFEAATAMHEYALVNHTKPMYESIPDAVTLLKLVHSHPQEFYLGVLTGNVEKMAYWKLTHVGIDTSLFSIFITSDAYEDRISLAKSVFAKVEKAAGILVRPQDTYILGDALGDIRCAHAISAVSIIATTGRHMKEELELEKPTLLVDSLMDERVLQLLQLK